MSTQIDQTIFQIGTVSAEPFSADCQPPPPGDWQFWKVVFPMPFPQDGVRVIVTASDLGVERGVQNIAAVGIAQDVTVTGFTLAARNSDCARGSADFNWMAVLETPGNLNKPIDLRMGVLQPSHFQPDCVPGDWQSWGVLNFSKSFPATPVILLTASNLNVQGWNPAVVGVVQKPIATSFKPVARNSDCREGDCTVYYVALSERMAGRNDLWVDTGEVLPQTFASHCDPGGRDWQSWNIYFQQPFLTPPFVFVTANNRGLGDRDNQAMTGIARNVTTHGFTLAAHNTDCKKGRAGFYWVAIGCTLGCGSGTPEG